MISIRVQSGNVIVKTEEAVKDCWIDARDVTPEDVIRLEKEFGISPELLTDILDVDEQARIEKEDDYLAIIIRLPVLDTATEIAYFTVPFGIILFPDRIVTVCQKANDVVLDVAHNKMRGLVMRNQASFVLNI